MPNAVLVLDLETVAQDAAAEAIMAAPFPADTWTPKNGATKPETVARQKEEAEAEWEAGKLARVDALALSPRTGRIVCAGYSLGSGAKTFTAFIEDHYECALLAHVWNLMRDATVVTFNGYQFDLPFLMLRSVLLGVPCPLPPERLRAMFRRYTYSPHADVRMMLTNWDLRAPGTKAEWAAAFGLPAQTVDGSQIGALYRACDADAIAAHCRADVEETLAMYLRLSPYYGA